jgi:hypothetical protein
LKIPLRIKVFGWYLRKVVALPKYNLAKWNWDGSKKCVFCHHDETIKHLFFQYRFARSIWLVIQVASSLFLPCGITNIFGNWLNEIDHRFKKYIRVGAIVFIWSLWLWRNDKVCNKKKLFHFVGYIQGYQYSLLMVISTEGRGSRLIYGGLCMVEGYTEEISQHGWPYSLRIGPSVQALLQLLTIICNFALLFYVVDTRFWLCASQLCRDRM